MSGFVVMLTIIYEKGPLLDRIILPSCFTASILPDI